MKKPGMINRKPWNVSVKYDQGAGARDYKWTRKTFNTYDEAKAWAVEQRKELGMAIGGSVEIKYSDIVV